jgi:hypothetical protein
MKVGATKGEGLKVLVLMESREFRIKIILGAEDLTRGSVSRISMVEGVPIKGDWTFPDPKDSKGVVLGPTEWLESSRAAAGPGGMEG